MVELHTEIEIAAPVETVWHILTDLDRYHEWNPFIQRAEGEVSEGIRLNVFIQAPGGAGMAFRPTVTRVIPEREFRWLGHLFVSGLFDGEHIFELQPLDSSRTRFFQRERFRGILVPLLKGMLVKSEHGFRQMNEALKRQAEEGSQG
jgi:hypothetical protein